jgi:hypothetical protein
MRHRRIDSIRFAFVWPSTTLDQRIIRRNGSIIGSSTLLRTVLAGYYSVHSYGVSLLVELIGRVQ